ncbi:putative nucleotidyltransferase, ribonuclease H, partial [Tanacetum coccineum]
GIEDFVVYCDASNQGLGDVRIVILNEAHKSKYYVHPGADKMYHDLCDMYWWLGMKRDIDIYVSYNYHPYHVVQYSFDKIREDLSFAEEPEAILDRQERVMRKKTIPLVKVLWKNHPEREATWENEEMMRTDYPHFFSRFELEAEFLEASKKLMGLQLLQLKLRLGKTPSRSFRPVKSAEILWQF